MTTSTFDFDTLPRLHGPRAKLPTQRTRRQVRRAELHDAFRVVLRPQHLTWIALWALVSTVIGSHASTLIRVSPLFGSLTLICFACLTVLFVGAYAPVIERERIRLQIAQLQRTYEREHSR